MKPLIVESDMETEKIVPVNDNSDNGKFKSRYLTDFETLNLLGMGGYGVVFEAKNKIDDCNYAIKRIALPNSSDSRERVMREVKALAKLDHHNIVRYFNAWLECPPAGWQEEHDQQWINEQISSSEFSSEVAQIETKSIRSICNDRRIDPPPGDSSTCKVSVLNNRDTNNDSSVIFKDSNRQQRDDSGVCTNAGSLNISLTSNRIEESLDSTNHPGNIVFGTSENNISKKEKEECKSQKLMVSLNQDNKSNSHKSINVQSITFLYIQMQLCQRHSLKEWLRQKLSPRNLLQILNIFQQIVDAVEYVHLQDLIHRDLKPSNIFFAYDDKIKIGDFGFVTEGCDKILTRIEQENLILRNDIHTACVGTHLYMSPEQMNGQIYNYKVDIYSLGIIFFELLTSFSTEMERRITLSNLRKASFPDGFAAKYPAEYNLLKMMLDEDPAKRLNTLGIRAKPPLRNYSIVYGFNINEDTRWHFELPKLARYSSITYESNSV